MGAKSPLGTSSRGCGHGDSTGWPCPPRPPKVPSAPRCNLLQLEVVGALLELLVLGLDGFAQFLQNLRWGEGDALARSVAELCRPGGPLLRT